MCVGIALLATCPLSRCGPHAVADSELASTTGHMKPAGRGGPVSEPVALVICVTGIYTCYLLYGYVQVRRLPAPVCTSP